jgi:single-strand DNA-binding protein
VLNSTVITVVGNLTDSPELRFTPSGVPMARFTVAVNPRVFDKATGEWRDGEASFYNCTAWRQLAENTAQSLSKGIRVIVTGTIAQQRWETDQGERRSTFAVTAEAVGPDLSYATATVRKTVRTGNDTTGTDDPWATASPNRPATASDADRRNPNDTEPATQPGQTPRPVRDTATIPASFNDDTPF